MFIIVSEIVHPVFIIVSEILHPVFIIVSKIVRPVFIIVSKIVRPVFIIVSKIVRPVFIIVSEIVPNMDIVLNVEAVSSQHNIKGLRDLYDLVESQVRNLKSLGVELTSCYRYYSRSYLQISISS